MFTISFKDKVVLISGGATGIGYACLELFLKSNAKVVCICGRTLSKLKEAKESILETINCSPGRVEVFECDIRKVESIDTMVSTIVDRYGRIDVLINNAGGQYISWAHSVTSKGFNAVVQNNLIGTWNMINVVGKRAMLPQRGGSIVNVVANMKNGMIGMIHSGAARAGVVNLTKTLALEWSPYHINVNAVAPGFIRTSAIRKYPIELTEKAEKLNPLGRLGTPEETAAMIVFLASDYCKFVQGQTIYVDGAQSLSKHVVDPQDFPLRNPERLRKAKL